MMPNVGNAKFFRIILDDYFLDINVQFSFSDSHLRIIASNVLTNCKKIKSIMLIIK